MHPRLLLAGLFLLVTSLHASVPDSVSLPIPLGKQTGYQEVQPADIGIDFNPGIPLQSSFKRLPVYVTNPGLAAGDVDGDGHCDLFLCRMGGGSQLYRNLGDWKFEAVPGPEQSPWSQRSLYGACFGDLDGDGDLDLVATSLADQSAVFLNDGQGHFHEDPAFPWSRSPLGGDITPALADIDGDGDLDLYVTAYRQQLLRQLLPPLEYQRKVDDALARLNKGEEPGEDFLKDFQIYSSWNGSSVTHQVEEKGVADALYLNEGGGRFRLASNDPGRFLDEQGQPMELPKDWGLSATFRDVDQDGDPDLYVCNDFLTPDRFWLNDGKGHFRLIDRLAIRRTSRFSMGVDFSDLDGDGDLDFISVDMLSRDHTRRKTQMGDMQPTPIIIGKLDDRPQIMQNTLFLNRGDGSYSEVAQLAGLKASEWSWSPVFTDVDLDGLPDLWVTTGMERDYMDSDTVNKIRALGNLPPEKMLETASMYPELNTRNLVFRNRGDWTFQESGGAWGIQRRGVSGGLTLADLDQDGDLDVVINNMDSAPEFYRNNSTSARVAIRLRGSGANTRAIGARLEFSVNGKVQLHEIRAGGVYASGLEPLAVFAVPGTPEQVALKVHWPSGETSSFQDLRPNRSYLIREAQVDKHREVARSRKAGWGEPLFADATDVLGHRHVEAPYDDFKRQSLLPNRLSQLGPGLTWYDVDGNGFPDLLIPSGRGGSLHVLLNEDGTRFADHASPVLQIEQTGLLAWRESESSGPRLLAGLSHYENTSTNLPTAQAFSFDLKKPWVLGQALPASRSATGPMTLGDLDGDGDLDLFIGGRVIPGQYPRAADSRLYLNDGGGWRLDERHQKAFQGIGMVTGAVFGDIDLDGDVDLVLAREWGSPMLWINDQGVLQDRSREWGLAGFRGWWNGVQIGDLDGDGVPDLVLSNWGRNSKYEHAYSLLKPLQIYSGDFDQNGVWDIVEAHYDKSLNMLVPERGLSCSSRAMPFVRERKPTYLEFGSSGLHSIYGNCLQDAEVVEADSLEHRVFLNRKGRFESHALPLDAQLSPGFGINVADFNGDGREDLFLAQNFFAVQIETPRNDGGQGLLLLGRGDGNFDPLPGFESGLIIHGEQRGSAIADFDRDGRVDLAVSQNGAATRLFRNVKARPGLRVRLSAGGNNPDAIGASVRLRYAGQSGPARSVVAGSGYWSQDDRVLVLATPMEPRSIEVLWPGGTFTTSSVPAGAREIQVLRSGAVEVLR